MNRFFTLLQTTFTSLTARQSTKIRGDAQSTPDQVRVCNRHQVPFNRYEQDGKVAYLHTESQGWCRYSESNVAESNAKRLSTV
jgi:hypothetical protein